MATQAVEERTLETLVGPLPAFRQLERATMLPSDQLTTERRTNPELRKQRFYVADSALYTVEKEGIKDEVFLYLGRGETNPVFNNIEEAAQQLIRTGNYIPPKEDVEAVKSAGTTLRVKLSDLGLQGNDNVSRYFEIGTANYDSLNEHQRRVAERVYGQGNDFVENMKMFNKAGIRKTKVYVLNPDYVKENVPQDGALARACGLARLGRLLLDSEFYADVRYVGNPDGLRGVRNVAEGDAPKIEVDPVAQAYDTLLGNQKEALEIMTPERVVGLLSLVTAYLNTQKQ